MAEIARFHTVHLYLTLPEPLDLPSGFGIQRLEEPGTYSGESFRVWDANAVSADDLVAGPMCRFYHRQAPVEIRGLDEMLGLARWLWPRIGADNHSPENATPASAEEEGDEHADLADRPQKVQTAVEVVHPIACPSDECGGEVGDQFIESALTHGLRLVQIIQKAVYAITRQPYTLATRQIMPFLVPVAIGTINGGVLDEPKFSQLRQVNWNLLSELPPADLSDADLATVGSLVQNVEYRTFFGYLDFQREALVAYRNRGDNRSAAIFLGLACERFLDDLLSHLMWEDGARPEDAPDTFLDQAGITVRVRRQFHPRLKGSWSTEATGPIADWWEQVAKVRNRVVHSNYTPTNDEIEAASQTAIDLVAYVSDCLAQRITEEGKYRLTALALMGEPGMRKRSLWTRRNQEAAKKFDAENLWARVYRWKVAAERQRARSFGDEPKPEVSRSYTMFVVRNSESSYWLQHDRVTAQARLIKEPTNLTAAQRQAVCAFESAVRETMTDDSKVEGIVVELANPDHVDVLNDWSEEYKLVPRAEVMVDGSDREAIH